MLAAELASAPQKALEAVAGLAPANPGLLERPGWHLTRYGRGLRDVAVNLGTGLAVLNPGRLLVDSAGYRADLTRAGNAWDHSFGTLNRTVNTLLDTTTADESLARWGGHLTPLALSVAGRPESVGGDLASVDVLVDSQGAARLLRPLTGPATVPLDLPTPNPGATSYGDLLGEAPPPRPVWPPGHGQEYGVYENAYGADLGANPSPGIMMTSHEGIVFFAVKATPETPSGVYMFDDAISHFPNTRGIRAEWFEDMPDNLDAFNRAVRSGAPEEQAVWLTFTGKMAARHGMTEVELSGCRGHPATAASRSSICSSRVCASLRSPHNARAVDLFAAVSAALAAGMIAVYVAVMRGQDDQPLVWVVAVLVCGSLLAAYGAVRRLPLRRVTLGAATGLRDRTARHLHDRAADLGAAALSGIAFLRI